VDFDFSREALLEPGLSRDFFDAGYEVAFDPEGDNFNLQNALWLAELSRLIYRQERDENPAASGPKRSEILARVGLTEQLFVNNNGTQCALLGPATKKWTALVFRGTNAPDDWLINLEAQLTGWDEGGSVHKGFKEALNSVWPELESALEGSAAPLFYAGHSLGAALATLAASKRPPAAVYTFGSPRVGNDLFVDSLGDQPIYRVVNGRDAVCQVPLPLPRIGFQHAGQMYYLTQSGQLISDSGQLEMLMDQWKWELSEVPEERKRLFLDLPKIFTDHAPVNYVAHLQRLIQ
jgi:triacylglycerol lipase